MKYNNYKKGLAIETVLIFASIMAIVVSFLLRSTQNYNKQLQVSNAQLQSYFIARAGVEHTMLKIKYLNRELYDAICLYQGRNPLFDYSQIKNMATPYEAIKEYNPGPIFLYEFGQYTAVNNTVYTDMSAVSDYDKWLKVFKEDLTSINNINPYHTNKTLDMDLLDPRIKSLMKDPFKRAQYILTDLDMGALDIKENIPNKVDNSVMVEFTIKSSYISSKDYNYDYIIKKTVKVSRE